MSHGFTHVIFDLDGTLLDSEPLYSLAAERVCAQHGKRFTLALKSAIMGGDTLSGAATVIAALDLPLTPVAYIEARERELSALWPTLTAMRGAPELIARLEALGIPMAIATSGHRHITEAKLAHHPFLQRIEVRITGDDPRLARGKPAPDIFLLAARTLAAQPERCLVVEDSLLGVQAGLAAGMRTIALIDTRYGFTAEQFRGAAQIIHALEELDLSVLGAARPAR